MTGACQVCGRVQKLVGTRGVVARHGFHLTGWGNTRGACPGSRFLPADTGNTSALDNMIASAHIRLDRAQRELADYARPDFLWQPGVVPAKAVEARQQDIAHNEQLIQRCMARRTDIIASVHSPGAPAEGQHEGSESVHYFPPEA